MSVYMLVMMNYRWVCAVMNMSWPLEVQIYRAHKGRSGNHFSFLPKWQSKLLWTYCHSWLMEQYLHLLKNSTHNDTSWTLTMETIFTHWPQWNLLSHGRQGELRRVCVCVCARVRACVCVCERERMCEGVCISCVGYVWVSSVNNGKVLLRTTCYVWGTTKWLPLI